jgi:hypothetical protein
VFSPLDIGPEGRPKDVPFFSVNFQGTLLKAPTSHLTSK